MKKVFEVRGYRAVGVSALVTLDVPNDEYIPTVEDIEDKVGGDLTWLDWYPDDEWRDNDITVYSALDMGGNGEEEDE